MEYRIAICDDEEAQREYLVSLVRSWSAEAGVTAKVTAFSSGESLLFGKDGQDIFLLDIIHFRKNLVDGKKWKCLIKRASIQ